VDVNKGFQGRAGFPGGCIVNYEIERLDKMTVLQDFDMRRSSRSGSEEASDTSGADTPPGTPNTPPSESSLPSHPQYFDLDAAISNLGRITDNRPSSDNQNVKDASIASEEERETTSPIPSDFTLVLENGRQYPQYGQFPSVSDLPSRTPQAQRSSFRIGIYFHHFSVPKECLICVFSAGESERTTYVGVVDQQLQNRIDDLQVYLREFPSVTLGRGVYRVADILAVILLLCEQFQQSTAEERQHGSLSYTLYNRLRLELKEELKEELEKELVAHQGILSSKPEASYVLREYRYSIAVQLAWTKCYRRRPNGQVFEAILMTPCRMLGGFRFRFWGNDLDDLFVAWRCSGQINSLGLWFESNTFGNLARLDGWSRPVPPLSNMGQTGLTVTRPSRQQDAEKDLRTV
jgi:hypothetical protein